MTFPRLWWSRRDLLRSQAAHYWYRHHHAWPVEGLEIGGAYYGRDALRVKMRRCTHNRISVTLLRHLIAAKLNVLSGADNLVPGVIADADAFFAIHGLTAADASRRRDGREIKRELRLFNLDRLSSDKSAPMADDDEFTGFPEEQMSLSTVKEMFR